MKTKLLSLVIIVMALMVENTMWGHTNNVAALNSRTYIYVDVSEVGWTDVNFYYVMEGHTETPFNNEWPGNKITTIEKEVGRNWYHTSVSYVMPPDYFQLTISTGDGTMRTVAVELTQGTYYLKISGQQNGEGYYLVDDVTNKVDILKNSEPYAVLSADGLTVTFYYDGQKTARGGMDINHYDAGTSPYGSATTAVIDASFADYYPTSTACWFYACSNLTRIDGMANLKTDDVIDMTHMFYDCSALTSLDVSGFNTANVTSMVYMFSGCSGLTSLDLSGFNTANVTNMSAMFFGCSGLTSLDVSGFNTANVTHMIQMFYGCSGLTSLDVSGFNNANVTWMSEMFYGCSGLTSLDLNGFNTANVLNMGFMFEGCSGLTSLDVSGFNTANVTFMGYMFEGCYGLTSLDVSSFNTANVTYMSGMFSGCSNLKTIYVGEEWSTAKVTYSTEMFTGCTALVGGMGTIYYANHTDVAYAHIDGGTANPGYLTSANAPSSYAVTLKAVGNGTVNTADITVANGGEQDIAVAPGASLTLAFTPDAGYRLENVTVDDTDVTSQVTADSTGVSYYTLVNVYAAHTVTATFVNDTKEAYAVLSADSLTVTFYYDTQKQACGGMDINSGYVDASPYGSATTAVIDASFADYYPTNTSYWFMSCSNLTSIDGMANLKTDNVTSMVCVFDGCSGLTSLDVSGFNIANVTDMSGMFHGCSGLTSLDVSGFNTANVGSMGYMFYYCSGLTSLDLSGFNTANVTDMSWMFRGCSNLTTIYVGEEWSTAKVTESPDMFTNCIALVGGMGTVYDANHTDAAYAHIDGGAANPGYLTSANAPSSYTVTLKAVGNGTVKTADITVANGGEQDIAVAPGASLTLAFTPDAGYRLENVTVDDTDVTSQVTADSTGVSYYTLMSVYAAHTVTATFVNDTKKAYAVLSADSLTVTFYYDKKKQERNGMNIGEWNGANATVTVAVFDPSFADYRPTSTGEWFRDFAELTAINGIDNLKTDSVTTMYMMFGGCSNLTHLDLSGFNTENVVSMKHMFIGCSKLPSLDVTHFNTANVEDMHGMFEACSALTELDLSSFNIDKVYTMNYTFNKCTNLKTIYVSDKWNPSNVSQSATMFGDCAALVGGAFTAFSGINTDAAYAHIDGGTANPGYLTSVADTAAVASVTFSRTGHTVTLSCETANTRIMYSLSTGTLEHPFTPAEANAFVSQMEADATTDESYYIKGKIIEITDKNQFNTQYGNCTFYISDDGTDKADKFYVFRTLYLGNVKYTEGILPKAGDEVIICGQLTNYKGNTPETAANKSYIYSLNGMTAGARAVDLDLHQYTEPLTLTEDCIIIAYAERPSGMRSVETTFNFELNANFVEAPTIARDGEENRVTITNNSSEGVVYYNFDENGLLTVATAEPYTAPIDVTQNTRINAAVIIDGVVSSGITSFSVDWFQVATPTFAANGNKIGISTTTEDATIYYTLDGTTPDSTSEVYTDSITIEQNCTVKAIAMRENWFTSEVATFEVDWIVTGFATFDGLVARVGGDKTLDDAFAEVGGRSEAAKTIAAVVWEKDTPLTDDMLEELADNPNLLVYVSNEALALANVKNVVVDGVAKEIVLADTENGNNNFHVPQAFTAERISYSHNYTQQTTPGVSRGWETLVLPFAVQTVTHEHNGALLPYKTQPGDKIFWLRTLTADGIKAAQRIVANMPYLISMPNNTDAYDAEYCQGGVVTFASENVTVPETQMTVAALADSSVVLHPTMQRVAQSASVYALNVGEPRGSYLEGSVFERDLRDVRPFECYTEHRGGTGGSRFITLGDMNGGNATGIDDLQIFDLPIFDLPIYNVAGQMVNRKSEAGTSVNSKLPKGVYIQRGRKVVIR